MLREVKLLLTENAFYKRIPNIYQAVWLAEKAEVDALVAAGQEQTCLFRMIFLILTLLTLHSLKLITTLLALSSVCLIE